MIDSGNNIWSQPLSLAALAGALGPGWSGEWLALAEPGSSIPILTQVGEALML